MSKCNFAQRTGLCAGVALVFRPPGPLLNENILMKLSTKAHRRLSSLNKCPALQLAEVCLSSPRIAPNPLCVSSEAAFVMRVGLSMGGEEQPSPSNRLHAALL
jgi:hypothetical protein